MPSKFRWGYASENQPGTRHQSVEPKFGGLGRDGAAWRGSSPQARAKQSIFVIIVLSRIMIQKGTWTFELSCSRVWIWLNSRNPTAIALQQKEKVLGTTEAQLLRMLLLPDYHRWSSSYTEIQISQKNINSKWQSKIMRNTLAKCTSMNRRRRSYRPISR
jgi:hypothetical protein